MAQDRVKLLKTYNTDGTLYWHVVDGSAHADARTDLQGREVLLQPMGTKTSPNTCPNPWTGVSVIDINAEVPVNCLMNALPALHVSYQESPRGWEAVSTFDHNPCPDNSFFRLSSDWSTIWSLCGEELLLVRSDGSKVYRLAHTRSRGAEAYGAQPHGVTP